MTVEELHREPIRFELDLPFADSGSPRQRLDLYLPAEPASERLPVILFLHGGGWRRGDRATGAARVLPFVKSGDYAAVSAGYRLSDEATWPAQIHDVKAAVRWIRAHADEYGFDPERIAAWGRSAGGHLALLLGLSGSGAHSELDGEVGPHAGLSSGVHAVVSFFGVTELPALLGLDSVIDRSGPDSPEGRLLGGPLPEKLELAALASPINYVSPDDPPVLTLHGTADRVVPYEQAVRLDGALARAGVESYLVPVVGAGHGQFPEEVVERVESFLSRVLLGLEVEVSTEAIVSPADATTPQ